MAKVTLYAQSTFSNRILFLPVVGKVKFSADASIEVEDKQAVSLLKLSLGNLKLTENKIQKKKEEIVSIPKEMPKKVENTIEEKVPKRKIIKTTDDESSKQQMIDKIEAIDKISDLRKLASNYPANEYKGMGTNKSKLKKYLINKIKDAYA